MGEKKRRLAAGGAAATAPTALDSQLAPYLQQCRQLEQAIAATPENHAALHRLSVLRHLMAMAYRERADGVASADDNLNRALDAITRALWAHPDSDDYWVHFADCIAFAPLRHPLDPRARDLLARALAHPAIQPLRLATPIVALVQSHPDMRYIEEHRGLDAAAADPDATEAALLLVRIEEVLREPLLLQLLALTIVAAPLIERLVVLARRLALRQTVAAFATAPPLPLAAMVALAGQCFATEYVYDVAAEEEAALTALEHAIESRCAAGDTVPPHWVAVRACYRALDTLPAARRLAEAADAPELHGLVRTQILEPAEERRLRAGIPVAVAAGDVTDNAAAAVSAAVGSLYEANPYPRWSKAVRIADAGGFREQLRPLLRHATPYTDNGADTPAILVAGCGTGQQSIETAQRYRDARVLAIDLSLASLAFAKRKTLELGLQNVEYRQHDILALSSLRERFDLIESIGVLHHLEDPLQGWRVLRQLLKPHGIMRIGLYSEIARRELIPLHRMVAELGLQPDIAGIRRCRAQVRSMFGSRLAASLAHSPDFYCASGCRDMLFHVMEHSYTLPQIGAMLEQLDLRLLGVHMPSVGLADRYRAAFPDDQDMTNLDYLHRFESANPSMFAGLCKFWAQAKN